MTDFLQDISKRLKIVRLSAGYHSAKKFTEEYAIPASTYCQHENGNRALTLENVATYAKLLNVDPAWLMTWRGSPCGEDYDKDLEDKILLEQERMIKQGELHAAATPLISEKNMYSNVNIPVFKKVLQELLPLLKDIPDPNINDVIDFCFDLYNKIIVTNAEGDDRIHLIKLCFASFFKGLEIRITEESLKNIAMAG